MRCGQAVTDDDDDAFLGAVSIADMVTRQMSEPELQQVIAYLNDQSSTVPGAFKRVVHVLTLRDNVFYKKNFPAGGRSCLLVVQDKLRTGTVESCLDDLATGRLGYSRTLARLRQKYLLASFSKAVRH